ncbi:insulinase family protein [Rickettsiales bacterium]|nr:insulinase family protein [Rickettsiales bacterium]
MKINQLPNKLRYAADYMPDVESVSIAVFVGSGSRNEVVENNGISHFLEHMAFKGTKTRTAKQIAEEFDNIGGRINAYTSREKTVYYVKVLKEHAKFAVEFLSDILQNSIFDQEEMDKERGVILQEIAMTNDTPDDILFDYFQETSFPNQAVGRSILGPEENIKKFDRSYLIDYVKNKYHNSNICITAAGNLKEEEFGEYVKQYFTDLSSGTNDKIEEANYVGGDFRKEKNELEQINLLLGFKSNSYLDEDYYVGQILSSILGGGMSSRLFQEVREKRGLAYSIYAFNMAYYDDGIFGIYAGTTPEQTNELINVTCEEVIKVSNKIEEFELQRSKNQVKSALIMSLENTDSRCQRIGNNILNYNKIISHQDVINKINNINIDQLTNYAKGLIGQKPTFSAIGKVKDIISYDKIKF